jgi:hypothetical protein
MPSRYPVEVRRRRIRQLEIELAVPGRSTGSSLFRAWPQKPVPGDLIRDRAGFDVQRAYLMLGLPQSGYYASKERPPSERTHLWPRAARSQTSMTPRRAPTALSALPLSFAVGGIAIRYLFSH